MSNPIYVLQKDICTPNYTIAAGSEFIKNMNYPGGAYVHNDCNLQLSTVENNPTWFKLKEEPRNDLELYTEIIKCKDSPYYFATKYLTVNGKPYTTHLTEEQYNTQFHNLTGQTKEQVLNEEEKPTTGSYDLESYTSGYVAGAYNCKKYCAYQHQGVPEKTPEILSDTVLEKEWEIVAFEVMMPGTAFDGQILPKTNGYYGVKDFNVSEQDLLKSSIHKIHSVKRLSDNEVFSIGDKVEYGAINMGIPTQMGLKETTIASFAITNGYMWAYGEGGFFIAPLSHLRKPTPEKEEKKVLFTTDIDTIANNFSVWAWGKKIPTEFKKLEGFIKRGLSEMRS
jgi:hypothetical protein